MTETINRLARRMARVMPRRLKAELSERRQRRAIHIFDSPAKKSPAPRTIPPQLFQTSPSLQLHPAHAEKVEEFRALNPDINHFVFDDIRTDEYMAGQWGNHPIKGIYDRALFGQMKADIFRYCIVWDRGGYYLDINKSILQPLNSLHSDTDHALISFEKNSTVVFPERRAAQSLLFPEKIVLQWAFGFSERHPVLEGAINRIVEIAPFFEGRNFNRILPTVVQFTGPGVLTWSLRTYLGNFGNEGIAQHPPDFSEQGLPRLPQSGYAFGNTKHYSRFKHHPVLAPPTE